MKINFISCFLLTGLMLFMFIPYGSSSQIQAGGFNGQVINIADSDTLHHDSFTENNEEILVVVTDGSGEENYSKVVITDAEKNIVINPSRKLAAGTYFVVASSHNNRLCNQRIR